MTTSPQSHEKHTFPWSYFYAALSVFCLGHWLGSLALRGIEKTVPAFHHRPLLLTGVSLSLLIGCSVLMRLAHHACPRPKVWRDRAWQFSLALGVLMTAFFTAVSLEHWLEHGPMHLADHATLFAALCFLLLIVAERVFRRLQQRLERPRDIRPLLHQRQEAAEALEALILFISPPNHPVELLPQNAADHHHAAVRLPQSGERRLKGAGHLETDIAELGRDLQPREYWNWQQLLRALRGHQALSRVVLIGSAGEGGSHVHLDTCANFLRPYLPPTCSIAKHAEALAFTDFNTLVGALRSIILETLDFLPKSRVGIDVTGGTATASIAGAAATMNLDCVFQYVDTNKPHETRTYDVLHEHGPHMH